jgi:hypothetical protein
MAVRQARYPTKALGLFASGLAIRSALGGRAIDGATVDTDICVWTDAVGSGALLPAMPRSKNAVSLLDERCDKMQPAQEYFEGGRETSVWSISLAKWRPKSSSCFLRGPPSRR